MLKSCPAAPIRIVWSMYSGQTHRPPYCYHWPSYCALFLERPHERIDQISNCPERVLPVPCAPRNFQIDVGSSLHPPAMKGNSNSNEEKKMVSRDIVDMLPSFIVLFRTRNSTSTYPYRQPCHVGTNGTFGKGCQTGLLFIHQHGRDISRLTGLFGKINVNHKCRVQDCISSQGNGRPVHQMRPRPTPFDLSSCF